MNMALGTLYGWSVFVAPLEKGIPLDTLSDFNHVHGRGHGLRAELHPCRRLQDKLGPFWIFDHWRRSRQHGILSVFLTRTRSHGCTFALASSEGWGTASAMPRRFRHGQVVSRQARPRGRPAVADTARGRPSSGAFQQGPYSDLRMAQTFHDPRRDFFCDDDDWGVSAEEPAGRLIVRRMDPQATVTNFAAKDYAPGEVLRTSSFYFLWLAYCTGASAGLMVISQLVPFRAQPGNFERPAGDYDSRGCGLRQRRRANPFGWFSDSLGRLNVLRFDDRNIGGWRCAALQGRATVSLLYVMVFVVYWCYGTQLSVNASTTFGFWGTANAGINYGMLFTAWGVAGIIGPYIGGQLFDKFKNYQAAFTTGAVLSAVALVFALLAKRPVGRDPLSS